MQRVDLEAEQRDQNGKGPARSLRREGKIPAVVYGRGKSTPLSLNPKDLVKILKSASGENALVSLKIKRGEAEETRTVIIRDYQLDPVLGNILHADLFEIDMQKLLRLRIPIMISGAVPAGVKEGGVLQHNLREVEIECLPSAIPDHLMGDAAHLKIGESLHVRDISVEQGVRILDDMGQAVVSISAPMSEAKLEEILAGTPAGEAKEPEVIGKAKEEELEAGAASDAAGGKAGEKPVEKGSGAKG